VDVMQYFGNFSWLIIPFGLFLGLLGYRLYKISLFIVGLFFGIALGSWIGLRVDNSQLGLILGVILGLAFGVATHFLIRFSLFLAGMAGGVVLATIILREIGMDPSNTEYMLWSLGAALAGGLLTLALYKILILFVTSLIGTFMIYQGTAHFFPSGSEGWSWILYLVLLVVFILVQIGARKGHQDPVQKEKDRRRR
jgi:hypothetical protein